MYGGVDVWRMCVGECLSGIVCLYVREWGVSVRGIRLYMGVWSGVPVEEFAKGGKDGALRMRVFACV